MSPGRAFCFNRPRITGLSSKSSPDTRTKTATMSQDTNDTPVQLPPLAALISRLSQHWAELDPVDPLRADINEAVAVLGAIEAAQPVARVEHSPAGTYFSIEYIGGKDEDQWPADGTLLYAAAQAAPAAAPDPMEQIKQLTRERDEALEEVKRWVVRAALAEAARERDATAAPADTAAQEQQP